ncbi:P-loop containing nucleoside triphosphate hydrolase protein [Calocera viscosa TUFC12733]|uniref:p-loop containing nucleoside triphosphate hydrolase protein n=1 Tax=Calocera viscosa (strain TUFC12733) TaxID=1330018 RepID=A0A167GJE0_CALVF|nr:P-loop containing nucleoside triphosphate hydrolase protein [Calocera viscosa TUFC12733]
MNPSLVPRSRIAHLWFRVKGSASRRHILEVTRSMWLTPTIRVNHHIHKRFLWTTAVRYNHNPLGIPQSSPTLPPRARGGLPEKRPIPHVSRVIAVSSAKGGVGKSTIAANLALTFQIALSTPSRPARVGLLDLDVFGPSVPKLLGLEHAGQPYLSTDKKILPLQSQGIYAMSMGFLLQSASREGPEQADVAVVWRGAMVQKAVQQLLFDVDWRTDDEQRLDLLVIDMPPGTGDVQLTLGQLVKVDGAVIVSTPQDLALADTRKGIAMFRKVDVPILGMLLNYAYFTCPSCKEKHYIFGSSDSFYKAASDLNVPVLGELPIAPGVSRGSDEGRQVCGPDWNDEDDSTGAERTIRRIMGNVGDEIWERLSRLPS